MQAIETREATPVKTRAPMHRKGSIKGRVFSPTTLKERLIARRQELNLSQLEVAQEVEFWNNKAQQKKTLSRSAYCMYESGDVTPDVDKLESIAKVLRCTPEWLAFGVGAPSPIAQIDYDAESGEFITKMYWNVNADWLTTYYDCNINDIVLCEVNGYATHLKSGEIAIVRKNTKPSQAGDEFIFVRNEELTVAHVTRPSTSNGYRVYSADLKDFEEVAPDDLEFVGKVVGKWGGL